MPGVKLKNYLHLHFLVFIAGFTAILGELISIGSISLVWYRMGIATILMYLYIKITGIDLITNRNAIMGFFGAGIIIALHWITFFEAIRQSNISITLAMFSTGAFFASFIEPLIYRKPVVGYEIFFGILVVIGVFMITQSEIHQIYGIVLGVVSAMLSSLFAVINGKFIERYNATVISFYEFISGVLFITLFIIAFGSGFSASFFTLSANDWIWLFILASICTAYAFIGSVKVMKHISPYTVVLSYNLEPVYGICLALWLFPETETMSAQFYYGALLILLTLFMDAVIKNSKHFKKKSTIRHGSD